MAGITGTNRARAGWIQSQAAESTRRCRLRTTFPPQAPVILSERIESKDPILAQHKIRTNMVPHP
jgi:hypothetical protein